MSPQTDAVAAYFDGFRRSDHQAILDLLTDDVCWDLPGFRHLEGKAAFDGEIENPAFEGAPHLVVDRLVEQGDTVVAIGEGAGTPLGTEPHAFRFAFCDVFTFAGTRIARVESYLVPRTGDG